MPQSSVVSQRQSSIVGRPSQERPQPKALAGMVGSLVVVWRLTEACDLNCAFCEYRRTRRRPRSAARADDVLAFGRVLGGYARESGRPVLLSWLGGEPLLWPPLWDVSRTLHRDHGLRLSLTTNGTHLDQDTCRRLVEDYAEVTLSVDGQAAWHEQVRGAPGLYPRLRAAAETLADLKSTHRAGPRLRANTVLMRSNVHALEDLGTTLASWGIQELTFNALGGAPGDPFYERERLLPEHIAWLAAALPDLRVRLAGRGLSVLGNNHYLHRLAHTAASLPLPIADCAPGQTFLFIDEAGRAAPCAFTSAAYGVPITTLRTPADIHALPARYAHLRGTALHAACADCPSTQLFGKFAPPGGLVAGNLPAATFPSPPAWRETLVPGPHRVGRGRGNRDPRNSEEREEKRHG